MSKLSHMSTMRHKTHGVLLRFSGMNSKPRRTHAPSQFTHLVTGGGTFANTGEGHNEAKRAGHVRSTGVGGCIDQNEPQMSRPGLCETFRPGGEAGTRESPYGTAHLAHDCRCMAN